LAGCRPALREGRVWWGLPAPQAGGFASALPFMSGCQFLEVELANYWIDARGVYQGRGSRTGAGARVDGLQIPCMIQWNFLAASVKHDGMVGTVGTVGTGGPQPLIRFTMGHMVVGIRSP
jgi:hypothetical protein